MVQCVYQGPAPGRSLIATIASLVIDVVAGERNLNKEDAMDRGRWKKLIKTG